MKKEFKGIQRKGLPGGPHEQFTYVTGVFMQDMYHVPEAQNGLEKYQGDEKSETKESRRDFIKRYNQLPFKVLKSQPDGVVKFDRNLTKEEIEKLGIITEYPNSFDIITSSLDETRNLGNNRRYGIDDGDEYAEISKNSELWKEIYKQDKKRQIDYNKKRKLRNKEWTGKKDFKLTQNVINVLNDLKSIKKGDKEYFRKYDTDFIEDQILEDIGIYKGTYNDIKTLRKKTRYKRDPLFFAEELRDKYIYNNDPIPTLNKGQEIIVSKDGQYAHPGKITRIPGNNITMKGVPYPVYAIPNVGMPTIMQSGKDYYFPDADYVDEIPMMYQGGTLPKYQGNKTSETPSLDLDFLMQGFPTVAAESTRVDTGPVPDPLPVDFKPTITPKPPAISKPMPVPTKTQETQYITEDKTSDFERGLQTLANPTGTNIDIPLSVLNPFAYMQGAYTAGTEALEGNLLPAAGAVVASRLPFLRPYVYNPVTKKGAKKLAQSKPGQFLSRAYEKTLGDKNLTIPLTGLGLFQGAAYDIPQFVSNFEKGEYYEAANDLFNAGTAFVPLATNLADTYKFGLGSFENLIGDAYRNFQHKRKLNRAVRNYKGPIYQDDLRNSSIYNTYNKGFNERTKHIFYDVEDEYRFYYPDMTNDELAYMVLRDPKILDLNEPVRKLNSLQRRVGDISFGHNLDAKSLTKFKDRPIFFDRHLPDEDILSSYTRPTNVEALILESYLENQKKFNNPLRGLKVERTPGDLADPNFVRQTTSDTEFLKDLILKQQLTEAQQFRRSVSDFKTKIFDREGNFLREDFISNMKPGENFQDLGFTSVSFPTENFMPDFIGNIKMKINAPKGQSALLPNRYPSLTRYPKENEMLLPPGLRYELDEFGEYNIINSFKEGGSVAKEVDKDMLDIYANYINGADESEDAINAYNKLNRIFYKESKLKNMSVPNYIMTHIIPNA